MTPQSFLDHYDLGLMWPLPPSTNPSFDLAAAYQNALCVRELRIARGEVPKGYKIGFTNRHIWPRYQVFSPIWGTVWDTTLNFGDDAGHGTVPLARSCQPRIEPETVFGMKAVPVANASIEDLFDAIEWVAPGFEVVQSHLPDWKFAAADTVADGGLHARLLVGRKVPVRDIAASAQLLNALLAATQVKLFKDDQLVEQGCGANVLDSPLRALHHFLTELRQCPGAPDIVAGDVITTGTWTDALPIQAGEHWVAEFSAPLSRLTADFL